MKRFYCTVCKKFKRVRQIPASVQSPNAVKPQDRVGQCKWHNQSLHDAMGLGEALKTLTRKVG